MIEWLDFALIPAPPLVLCTTEEKYLEACASIDASPYNGGWLHGGRGATYWFDHMTPGVACIVTVDAASITDPVELAGVLTHEATHVFQFNMEHIGETNPSREFMAYSIQNITVQLTQAFNKQTAGETDV